MSSSVSRPRRFLLLASGLAVACGGSGRYPGPDAPAPLAWIDTLAIAEPEESDTPSPREWLDKFLVEVPEDALSIRKAVSGIPPALNVDAFDEVPPSTWWEPRITAGRLSTEQIADGPPLEGPDTSRVLTVVAGKVDGVTPGFTVEDARGVRFLLKFDPPGMSGLGSGADAVSSRIFWAAGYHVPKDVVIWIDPRDLALDDNAEVETASGERAMTRGDIESALERTDRRADGRVRTLASRFLDGTPKGPFRFEDRRGDDPNDYYPHEDRRELRGIWVLAAWTNHVDLRAQNTLDMFIEPGGYLRHHVIDFATTLGSGSIRTLNPREGMEYAFDTPATLARLATLGVYRVGWEGTDGTPLHPALGWLRSDFDPGGWKPFVPAKSHRRLTAPDGYWGAKLVAAFSEDDVRGVIDRAHYPPEAATLLLDVLMRRQRHVMRYWFGRVSPLEQVTARRDGDRLELGFRDLGLDPRLWSAGETTYAWRAGDGEGVAAALPGDRQRIGLDLSEDGWSALDRATNAEPLTLEIEARRDGTAVRPVHVRLHRVADRIAVTGVLH